MTIKNLLLVFVVSLGLTGCKQEEQYTTSYLMQHPQLLKQEVQECGSATVKTKEETSQCEVILYAASNMISIQNEQQANPEKFGQRVMDAEVAYVNAKAALLAAQQALESLKIKQAPAVEIKAWEDKVNMAQKEVRQKREDVKILLAILGMSNSPD